MNSSRSSTSSSTESSSSSSSSSCSESGSSSTDSESSSSSDAKGNNESPKHIINSKDTLQPNAVTDRKNVEQKISSQKTASEVAKILPTSGKVCGKSKQQSNVENNLHSLNKCGGSTVLNADDATLSKKNKNLAGTMETASNQTVTSNLRRKNSSQGFVMASSRLQKVADVISERNLSAMDSSKMNSCFDENNSEQQQLNLSPIREKSTLSKQSTPHTNFEVKSALSSQDNTKKDKDVQSNSNTTPVNKNNSKRSSSGQVTPNNFGPSKRKYINNYVGNSGTEASNIVSSSDSSDTETDSDSSYSTKAGKGKRYKRGPKSGLNKKPINSDTEDGHNIGNRKLTRSLSTRCNKMSSKLSSGTKRIIGSDSDTDTVIDKDTKRSHAKSPTKKPYTGLSSNLNKIKVKKESGLSNMPHIKRAISPLQIEKKCAIEGCDSSGHLSGNLDRHFLPEACPIYHNMSVSECKERASERKLQNGIKTNLTMRNSLGFEETKVKSDNYNGSQTNEQKEFYYKIIQSRNNFTPLNETFNTDKVKLEKDCTDEDREPNLIGLVPDYDLQLFREAQALASEKIEDDVKDLPIGKGIKYITMGKYRMKVWYQSPYPEDVARLPQMYICEFCLRYQKSETGIKRHAQKCVWRHPPGDEIYRKGKLQVWQVDGKKHKQYCQHLCLLAKFFLDHKTLYYDVEPFLFYIMTLADVDGCHTVGYFSKEKNSFYNVSCILTLPPYQRKGYGRLLIDFSYLLTRVEGKIGSPEKPLSDLGLISYRSYWKDVLLDYLCNRSGNTLSIKDVSQEMAIYSYDIVSTLQALGMMKYWKGKHIVLKKQDVLDEYEERIRRRGTFPKIDESCLRWMPFVPTQSNDSS